MDNQLVKLEKRDGVRVLCLNDPLRRNALGLAMFDALGEALDSIREDSSTRVVLMRGEGPAFCAGFDLGAAAANPELMEQFIRRLSVVNRTLRRLPQIVVASVHGAAIAGGCAVLGACDFVVVAADAKLGYPVHLLGISPAVTIPTLFQAVGPGEARALLLSGKLIDGVAAVRRGLATHVEDTDAATHERAAVLAAELAAKPPNALRVTKDWLNELDGSLDNDAFDRACDGSAAFATGEEAVRMLRNFWSGRQGKSST